MLTRSRYKRRPGFLVTAVRLDLASAVSVPVLSSAGMSSTLIATLGGAFAAVSSLLSLFQFLNNGAKFRLCAEDLRSHVNQYHVGAGCTKIGITRLDF